MGKFRKCGIVGIGIGDWGDWEIEGLEDWGHFGNYDLGLGDRAIGGLGDYRYRAFGHWGDGGLLI